MLRNKKKKKGGQESYLTFVAYSRIVEKAKHKIADNKIYPKTIRDELRCYTHNNGLQDIPAEFCDIDDLYKRLTKSGNAERFYSCFYSTIALNAVKHFKGLSRNAATLLSTKVADCMLVHSKEKIESTYTCAPLTKLQMKKKLDYSILAVMCFINFIPSMSVNHQKVSRQSPSLRLAN